MAAASFLERGSKVFVSDNCTEQKLMASLETRLSDLNMSQVVLTVFLIASINFSRVPLLIINWHRKQVFLCGLRWNWISDAKATFLAATGSTGGVVQSPGQALKAAGKESAVRYYRYSGDKHRAISFAEGLCGG